MSDGEDLHAGLIDDLGRPLSWLTPTAIPAGPEAAAEQIGAAVLQVIEAAHVQPSAVARVGLGVPGVIDAASGALLEAVRHRTWQRFPLRDRVSHACRLPVTLVNDADAAAWGEFWVGSAGRFRSMVLLTLGTGVGSGIIIGDLAAKGRCDPKQRVRPHGDLLCRGRPHVRLRPARTPGSLRQCDGRRRSAPGEALHAGRGSSLSQRLIAAAPLSAELVAAEAAGGDPLALEIVMDTARYLAAGIVSVLHTVDPNGVLLGGTMTFGGPDTELGRRFLARVREEVGRRAFPLLAERSVIDFAVLGGAAAVFGAAGLARLESQGKPQG